jgi:hypothetical protein
VCLRCVEAQLTASLKGRQSNKEVLSDAEGTTP